MLPDTLQCMHRTAPTTKNYLAQRASRAEVEKLYLKGSICASCSSLNPSVPGPGQRHIVHGQLNASWRPD